MVTGAAIWLAGSPPTAVADDLIVRYAPGTTAAQRAAARTAAGVERRERLPLAGLEVVAAKRRAAARAARTRTVAGRLEAQAAVLSAERDVPVHRAAIPD